MSKRSVPRRVILLLAGGVLAVILAQGVLRALRATPPGQRGAPPAIPPTIASSETRESGTPSGTLEPPADGPASQPREHVAGRFIEDLPQKDSAARELTEEERGELDRILQRAQRSDVTQLAESVLASSRAQDGRQLHLDAWLFAWAIARDPGCLARLKGLLLGMCTSEKDVRDLLISVGMAGTPEARATLLRWLDDPELRPYEAHILEALHQNATTDRGAMEFEYKSFIGSDPRPWPNDLTSISVCTDRIVLEATVRRLSADSPCQVRLVASKLLCRVNGPGEPPLNGDLQRAMRGAFWTMFRDERDPTLRNAASYYVNNVSDPEIHAQLWEMYNAEPSESLQRGTYARMLAVQSTSIKDTLQVLETMRRDPSPLVRSCFLGALRFFDRSSGDKKVLAENLALWAPTELDEDLRQVAVQRLEQLLPESAGQFDWAAKDPSEKVRARAEIAIKKSKVHTRPSNR